MKVWYHSHQYLRNQQAMDPKVSAYPLLSNMYCYWGFISLSKII